MNNIFSYKIDEFCCGCRACEYICPTKCIIVDESKMDGFLYPRILEENECLRCGACMSVCPILSNRSGEFPRKAIGVVGQKQYTEKSASGAMFPTIAEYILAQGGVVFGCEFDGKYAVTRRATDIAEIEKMQSSKYVQCNTNEMFLEIKNDLIKGVKVLYCSTPCQIAALLNYLRKPYDNLVTMDLFCHGVPSPGLLRRYLEYLEDKYKRPITEINFRDKKMGWGTAGFIIAGKKRLFLGNEDPYYYSFLKTKTYQKSCYRCPYANGKRVGDFSIGDFWGVEKEHPEIDASRGVSAVLVNSKKAEDIMNAVNIKVHSFETEFEIIRKYNSVLEVPTAFVAERNLIYGAYSVESMDSIVKNYLALPYSKIQLIKKKVVQILEKLGFGKFLEAFFATKHKYKE